MKIFIPMPDDVLIERRELIGRLVPFNPDFLAQSVRPKEGCKPRNWISDNDYETACERLNAQRKAQQANHQLAIRDHQKDFVAA